MPAPTLERTKILSEIASTWLGILAIIFGGLFAVQQYLDKEKGEQVKEALNFLDRYHRESFSAARAALDVGWEKHDAEYQNFWKIPKTGNFDDKGFNDFVVEVVVKEKLQQHLFRMIEFYEALDVCVERNICDRETCALLFKADARAYFNLHHSYISKMRIENNNLKFADGFEHFVKL